MRRFTLTAALLAALTMTGSAMADADVEWAGGTDSWDLGNWTNTTTSTTGNAASIFGVAYGWEATSGSNLLTGIVNITIDGSDSVVDYQAAIVDDDFVLRSGSTANVGTLTVSGGAKLDLVSNGDTDGEWSELDTDVITVTGAGSLLERTATGTSETGGAVLFGSWQSYVDLEMELNVLEGGKFKNDGAIFFGAPGDNDPGIKVTATIGSGGAIESFNSDAANIDDSACNPNGEPCQGDFNMVYGYDDDTSTFKGEDYKVNFTGHGGSLQVGAPGIFLMEETGVEDTVGDRYVATKVTYQQMYAGVTTLNPDDGDAPMATKQILQANGSNALPFGDNFAVTNASGDDGYKVTMVREAGFGGTNVGDITGDGAVNAADAGAMFAGWSTGATPGTTISEGDIASGALGDGPYPYDNTVNAIDFGVMNANWTGDPGPATAGTAAAEYNYVTGEIIVSADGVNNWYVISATDGLTGATPLFPNDDNGFRSDSDNLIGETALGILPGFTDHSLGLVAQLGLLEGDLTIWSNAGVGAPLLQGMVERVPEPASVALIALGLCGVLASRRRLVA